VFLYGFAKRDRENLDVKETRVVRERESSASLRRHGSRPTRDDYEGASVRTTYRGESMSDKTTDRERQRFATEMAESFGDLRELGLIDESAHKRTLRDLNAEGGEPAILPLSGADIRALRERANVSQAFLAKYLNLSTAHLSKLERGAAHPSGPLLAMLNVIRRRGRRNPLESGPSRRDPVARAPRMGERSPGSRAKSFRTCQGLRPRRAVRALAMSRSKVLPSAYLTASAPGMSNFSRLNGWPVRFPTDASPQTPSLTPTHGPGPMRFATPSSCRTFTDYSLPVSRRTG